ncbi:unnamed protein product [Oikopleura dioica]|uniref:Uncharacterized protein n=1 Tax=Oikopleura dioica TaxID=34765 RepID=E4WUU8_OIKDI|nr:unnamed protein product [Oikopleura dioica]CBY34375.1 unnamed protein product [Oikopleura dioica]
MVVDKFESQDYPYRKFDVIPKVEGIASIPKDQKKPANPLYRTSNGTYGGIPMSKFDRPASHNPIKATITKYKSHSLGERNGAMNCSKDSLPLGMDGMYSAARARAQHEIYLSRRNTPK